MTKLVTATRAPSNVAKAIADATPKRADTARPQARQLGSPGSELSAKAGLVPAGKLDVLAKADTFERLSSAVTTSAADPRVGSLANPRGDAGAARGATPSTGDQIVANLALGLGGTVAVAKAAAALSATGGASLPVSLPTALGGGLAVGTAANNLGALALGENPAATGRNLGDVLYEAVNGDAPTQQEVDERNVGTGMPSPQPAPDPEPAPAARPDDPGYVSPDASPDAEGSDVGTDVSGTETSSTSDDDVAEVDDDDDDDTDDGDRPDMGPVSLADTNAAQVFGRTAETRGDESTPNDVALRLADPRGEAETLGDRSPTTRVTRNRTRPADEGEVQQGTVAIDFAPRIGAGYAVPGGEPSGAAQDGRAAGLAARLSSDPSARISEEVVNPASDGDEGGAPPTRGPSIPVATLRGRLRG